ncbi:MAG TPA: hypothetical protein VH165_34905 [Kofleriaceae bacterium]|jgi:hypothetical protein|nr:hypothetical protein [Kofleriaceae bacterium]
MMELKHGIFDEASIFVIPITTRDSKFDRFHLRSLNATLLLAEFCWKGWPNALASDPRIFLTEGGMRNSAAAKWNFGTDDKVGYENYQSFLGYRNLQRLATDTLGLGCEMFLNYLLISYQNAFDCGLVRRSDDASPLLPRSYCINSYKPFPGRL